MTAVKRPRRFPTIAPDMELLWPHPFGFVVSRPDNDDGDMAMLTMVDVTVRADKERGAGAIAAIGRAVSRLECEQVVTALATRVSSGGRIVIESVRPQGRPLMQLIANVPLPVPATVGILRQTIRALSAAHEGGVMHHALTPYSVIVGDDDRHVTRVTDFGLGRLEYGPLNGDAETAPLSPEKSLGLESGPAQDVYLFGCLAFRALTGRAPFRGGTAESLARRHAIEDAPDLIQTAAPRPMPAALAAVVMQCLAKYPEDRFPDAAALEIAWCEAQIADGISTAWDRLPLPAMPAPRRTAIEQGFAALAPPPPAAAMPPPLPTQPPPAPAVPSVIVEDLSDLSLEIAIDADEPERFPDQAADTDAVAVAPVTVQERAMPRIEPPKRRVAWLAVFPVLALLGGGGYFMRGELQKVVFGEPAVQDAAVAEADTPEAPDTPEVAVEAPKLAEAAVEEADPEVVEDDLEIVDDEPGEEALAGDEPVAEADKSDEADEADEEDADEADGDAEGDAEAVGSGGGGGDNQGRINDLMRQGNEALTGGKKSSAEGYFKQVLALKRNHAGALTKLGGLAFSRGDMAAAAKYLKRAVKVRPRNAALRIQLGDAYYKLGKYGEAKKHFKKADGYGHPAAKRRLELVASKGG